MGLPNDTVTFVAQDDWPKLRDIGQTLPEAVLVVRALDQRPDLQDDQLHADQAGRDLALAEKLNIPDVTVSTGYTYDASNSNLDSTGVGISIPLNLF